MSDDKKDCSNSPADVEEVGYGKPPKQHQFKKGVSGNPSGRPRKRPSTLDIHEMLADELLAPVTVVMNGKKRKMPRMRAFIMQQCASLLKGGPVSRPFLDLMRKAIEQADLASRSGFDESDFRTLILRPDEPGPEDPIL